MLYRIGLSSNTAALSAPFGGSQQIEIHNSAIRTKSCRVAECSYIRSMLVILDYGDTVIHTVAGYETCISETLFSRVTRPCALSLNCHLSTKYVS